MSKSVASRKRTSKKIQDRKIEFLPEEKVHVGLDVHKRTYSVTLWSTLRDSMVTRWTQPADPDALIRSLAPYKKRIDRAVYEAGPTGYGLVRALGETGFRADVIAPSRTPKTTCQEAKSDRIDSRKLAMWSAKNLLRAVGVPTPEEEGDREVFRSRDDAVKKRRRIKQQIKSFLLRYGLDEPTGLKDWALKAIAVLRKMELSPPLRFTLDMLLGDLDHCDSQVKKATAALKKLAAAKRHKKKVEALLTVPGVGPVTAMAVRTELIAPERFDNGRQVAAMAGARAARFELGRKDPPGPLDEMRKRPPAHDPDRIGLALDGPGPLGRGDLPAHGAQHRRQEESDRRAGPPPRHHPLAHQRDRRALPPAPLRDSRRKRRVLSERRTAPAWATNQEERGNAKETEKANEKDAIEFSTTPLGRAATEVAGRLPGKG